MKKFYLIPLLIIPVSAFSQAMPQNVRAQFTMDRIATTNFGRLDNTGIMTMPAPPGGVIGDVYLDSKWNKGSLMIKGKNTMVEGYFLKYDLKTQNLEIRTSTGIRLLDVRSIGHMVWLDSLTGVPHYFVNAANYKEDGVPLVGLLEVVVDGHRALLKRAILNTKSPTYVPALDVGSRDTEIYKKWEYFYNDGENVIQVKSKKKFLEGFGDKSGELGMYMKDNKLDTKSEKELTSIFDFYNRRLAPQTTE